MFRSLSRRLGDDRGYRLALVGWSIRPSNYRCRISVQVYRYEKEDGWLSTVMSLGINSYEMDWWRGLEEEKVTPIEWLQKAPVSIPCFTIREGNVNMTLSDGNDYHVSLPLSRKGLQEFARDIHLHLGGMMAQNPLNVIGVEEGQWVDLRHIPSTEIRLSPVSTTRWLSPWSRWRVGNPSIWVSGTRCDVAHLPAVMNSLTLRCSVLSGKWSSRCRSLCLEKDLRWEDSEGWSQDVLHGLVELKVSDRAASLLPHTLPHTLRKFWIVCHSHRGYLETVSRLAEWSTVPSAYPNRPPLDLLHITTRGKIVQPLTIPDGVRRVITDTANIVPGDRTVHISYSCAPRLEWIPHTVERIDIHGRYCRDLGEIDGVDVYVTTSVEYSASTVDRHMSGAGYYRTGQAIGEDGTLSTSYRLLR